LKERRDEGGLEKREKNNRKEKREVKSGREKSLKQQSHHLFHQSKVRERVVFIGD
jgi:hypothetical protein